MRSMRDLNYFPLNVESSIYGMTTLEFDDGTSKVLVATTDCQVYCINYCHFKPCTREVEFTYIPYGARIISIGSLKRGKDDFAIGITHSLVPSLQRGSSRSNAIFSSRDINIDYGRATTYYFNIYASASVSSTFDLDHVAQGCQTIRLRYTPYHLYQTKSIAFEKGQMKTRPFWLLSGGDNNIHAFCEDRPSQSFAEVPLGDCFPELSNINGLTLWIDVNNISLGSSETCTFHRVVALGLEDGTVKLFHSTLSKGCSRFSLLKESSFDCYNTIIPSVRFFKINSISNSDVREKLKTRNMIEESGDESLDKLKLLVVSSTEPCLIFDDVINRGLECKSELPKSQRPDCIVTSAIGDVNIDGYNEILLGTHGRELLTYQYDPELQSYYLNDVYELNYPLYALSLLNLTGDSLKELTVLLASGILVLQVSVKNIIKICQKRVASLLAISR